MRLEDLPPIAVFGAMRTVAVPGGSAVDALSATRDKFVALAEQEPTTIDQPAAASDQPQE